MSFNLRGRSFLKLLDFSQDEIKYLLTLSKQLKDEKRLNKKHNLLQGKNIVILFQKDSTRTRCAFEVAGYDLGMGVTYLGPTGSQMGKKESVADTARVLGRMYDGIEFRGYLQSDVETLAKYAGVPVWNGLTDDFHPTQILADFLTIMENNGGSVDDLKGKKLVFAGDARNNMGNSYMVGAAKMGMHFVSLAPKELWPNPELVKKCQEIAKETGATIAFETDMKKAVKDADAIATDVWVSMGEPAEVWDTRIKLLKPYQVSMEMLKATGNPNVIFLHCLPAFHDGLTDTAKDVIKKHPEFKNGMEVTNDVFESKYSKVWDEAENRLHTIKAVILATVGA